jgi:hypothetical protein
MARTERPTSGRSLFRAEHFDLLRAIVAPALRDAATAAQHQNFLLLDGDRGFALAAHCFLENPWERRHPACSRG